LHKILKEKNKEQSDAKKLPIEEGRLSKGSVIIYVWRQKDTEIVAEQLNGAGVRGGVRTQIFVKHPFFDLPRQTNQPFSLIFFSTTS